MRRRSISDWVARALPNFGTQQHLWLGGWKSSLARHSQCRCAASPPVSLLRSFAPSARSVPTSPWADHPVAHPPQPKSIFDKDVPPEEMIQGLLKMMPVGARTVTILPPEAVEEMSKEGKSRTRVCHVVVDAHSNGLKSRAVGLTATVGSERRVGPCPPLASTPAHPISATRA